MAKKKEICNHEDLRIFRRYESFHCSEVIFVRGDDWEEDEGDHEFSYKTNYGDESPDLLSPTHIKVICTNEKCNEKWERKIKSEKDYRRFPFFIQQVLENEEEYIKKHY